MLISCILFCVRFPTCPKNRQIWIKKCRLANEEVLPNSKVCSFHFEPTCFKSGVKRRLLYLDAVPTIFGNGRVKTLNLPSKNMKGIIHFLPMIIVNELTVTTNVVLAPLVIDIQWRRELINSMTQ